MIRTPGHLALAGSALLLVSGCFDPAATGSPVIHPTLVGVSPVDFLHQVPCRNAEGAMRSYTATLFDVSASLDQPFELPTSSLVPCHQAITFAFVVPGHDYVARVRGYDRTDLRKQHPGSPHAVDASGRVVPQRWTTECGNPVEPAFGGLGAGGAPSRAPADPGAAGAAGASVDTPPPGFSLLPVTSASRFTVYADYCLPLVTTGTPGDTRVSVELGPALGNLACGSNSGQLSSFSAELEGSTSPPVRVACNERALFSELEPGRDYRVTVLGFEHEADRPRWTTTCRATALAGTITPASCDPLVER